MDLHVLTRRRSSARPAPLLGTASALFLLCAGAHADIDAGNPDRVRKAMQDFGLVATMEEDSSGDPLIGSRLSSTRFYVYFYDCSASGLDCESIQFTAGYNVSGPVSASRANEWNRNKRYGKMTVDDDGDPRIEMDVNLDGDGVSNSNFADSLDIWRLVLEQFEDFIDWG